MSAMDRAFRHKNHYVPEFLLKGFSAPDRVSHLWEYRLLVEDARVPEWQLRAASLLAKTSDLYTISESTEESDRMERWLDEEFERPAKDAVVAATTDQRLNKTQWRQLIRFYAAQFLRTPAYYVRHHEQWATKAELRLRETQERLLAQLPKLGDIESDCIVVEGEDGFPLRCTIRRHEGLRRSLHIQHVTGRKYWMWAIQIGLHPNGMLAQLEEYKWSILTAPQGVHWFLTDNPAVCIRRRRDGTQTLDGGWGAVGSRLMLALSPKHLMHYQVGNEGQARYDTVAPLLAVQLRAHLADAALRSFYSHIKDNHLAIYRPRKVDRLRFQNEANQWTAFGQEHSRAERFE